MSLWGFQSESYINTVSAVAKLMPRPPARVESKKQNVCAPAASNKQTEKEKARKTELWLASKTIFIKHFNNCNAGLSVRFQVSRSIQLVVVGSNWTAKGFYWFCFHFANLYKASGDSCSFYRVHIRSGFIHGQDFNEMRIISIFYIIYQITTTKGYKFARH